VRGVKMGCDLDGTIFIKEYVWENQHWNKYGMTKSVNLQGRSTDAVSQSHT
jgi:hypothetical protein